MNILFAINHPAQYHFLKNIYDIVESHGHNVSFAIKNKDILEVLLKSENRKYVRLANKNIGKGKLSVLLKGIFDLAIQEFNLLKYCLKFKPTLMAGTDYCIAHIGKILNIPTIVFNEDDFKINRYFCRLAYPFCDLIMTPSVCDVGKYSYKKISYDGFQKLAYLHPNRFSPDINVLRKYVEIKQPYVIIRLVRFAAGHDVEMNHSGITNDILVKIINSVKLNNRTIFISSESALPVNFQTYKLNIDQKDIHHILAYADLFIADSQSMIVEAAMLGTPSIRYNSFVGQISVLNELENRYHLTVGIGVNRTELLIKTIGQILVNNNIKQLYEMRRGKMIREKIEVTSFVAWFIENYPESVTTMRKNPQYQYNFK